ncbi:glycosyl transferase [Roseibium aggregatum IAM 12614]|uniref:Glycosyl transferase n=1 Tax=Roseibium aggregatum (strain ATCC 25650 / DSM 13394 / JCM 20685 / NBRC 16684 / NCIMB 2208 / IAM 12614 / B1) TaxID=384765 RepID=A0NPK0_ROSAI|nr:glycosyltransferase family 2 protein [Roseibium aggregatum]EAV45363.1 glycosyl transferase [Roseibium aggregatum IAM 12614]
MTQPRFTVLLPVNRPPALLPFAVDSVLGQSLRDFELFIVCDGAPEETVEAAEKLASDDDRIRVFSFAKGERHGEAHRHTALLQANGRYVAQIGDDDIWFPEHLSELDHLLQTCDFGNLLQAEIMPDGAFTVYIGDLSDADTRRKMLESKWNFFGPSTVGYSLEAYRSLDVGWSPAPSDLWTDLFMWRKFLARTDLTFATRPTVQCIKPSAVLRQDMSLSERQNELAALVQRFADPAERQAFQTGCNEHLISHLRSESRRHADNAARHAQTATAQQGKIRQQQAEIDQLKQRHNALLASRSWKMTAPFRAIGKALQKLFARRPF